jgi:hypothetical protein
MRGSVMILSPAKVLLVWSVLAECYNVVARQI